MFITYKQVIELEIKLIKDKVFCNNMPYQNRMTVYIVETSFVRGIRVINIFLFSFFKISLNLKFINLKNP